MNERQPVPGVYGPQAHLMRVGGTLYRIKTALNVRSGPGLTYPKIINTPLPAGTVVRDIGYVRTGVVGAAPWKRVNVLSTGHTGWVHGAYLERV